MSDYLIILFNGFASSKLWYDYAFEDKPLLRKLDFLDRLKEIGTTYTVNQVFFNINYYATPNTKKEQTLWKKIYEKYSPTTSNINFNLEDLDYKNICINTYNVVKAKYGKNKKYIVIGHSYGGGLALLFSKMYKSHCILCCCIDNPPYTLEFFNKYNDRENSHILEKYKTNSDLKKSLRIIKNSSDVKEKNKEIDDVFKLISCKSSMDRIKYYDNKLYIRTIFIRAHNLGNLDWNKYARLEKKSFNADKNLVSYVMLKGAEHFVWKKQEFSDVIIKQIIDALAN